MRRSILLGLAFAAFPAAAQDVDNKKVSDSNKVICRSEPVLGSRLQTSRTCLTRQQWAERERDMRRVTERVQDFKPANGR